VKTNNKKISPKTIAVAASLAAMQIGAAYAQSNDALKLDEMVITASPEGRSKMKQSLSVSSIDSEQIANSVATSSAELLRTIPGVRTESSAGDGNANVTVRGVPISAGGSRYVQFQEDGLPVLLYGDFNFVTPDMFIRADSGTDGLEVVRGGSASTMATNAAGGVINFISKVGEVDGGNVGVTTNLGGADQKRYDFGYGKRTSDTSTFQVSGFIRDGEGPRKTDGVKMEQGGQFRAAMSKDLGGGNSVKLYAKFLDEKTPLNMPVPISISNGKIVEINGVDPRTFSPYSSKLPAVGSAGLYGRTGANMNDGLHVKSKSVGAEVNLNMGNGWIINDKVRISQNSATFDGILPDSYQVGTVANGQNFRIGSPTSNQYTALLLDTQVNDASIAVNDFKATKAHALSDGTKLTTTAGVFMGSQRYNADWEIGRFTSTLPVNQSTSYGSYRAGEDYQRNVNQTFQVLSPYAATSWEKGQWIVDASVRSDRMKSTGTWADKDSTGATGLIDFRSTLNSYSLGANYTVNKNTALFARISDGGSLPGDRVLKYKVACGTKCMTGEIAPNKVQQYEAGIKLRQENVSTFVTAFKAKTNETNFDVTTGVSSANKYDAQGVELEVGYKSGGFRLNGGVTYTDAEVVGSNNASYVGKAPNRQAKFLYALSPSYRFAQTTAGLSLIGTTASKDAQTTSTEVELPAYHYVNAFVNHDLSKSTVVSLGINNLTNSIGYTEGNGDRSAARSINGRTARLTLRYNF
jgi:outer membrane receptor protein involved in Fe transport